MICSRCRRDKPETDFAPQRWTMLTKYVKSKQCLVRYRKKHKRGRRYDCHACCREWRAWNKKRPRCHHGLLGSNRCQRKATHQCPVGGAWRACSEHQLPGDEPIMQVAAALP